MTITFSVPDHPKEVFTCGPPHLNYRADFAWFKSRFDFREFVEGQEEAVSRKCWKRQVVKLIGLYCHGASWKTSFKIPKRHDPKTVSFLESWGNYWWKDVETILWHKRNPPTFLTEKSSITSTPGFCFIGCPRKPIWITSDFRHEDLLALIATNCILYIYLRGYSLWKVSTPNCWFSTY